MPSLYRLRKRRSNLGLILKIEISTFYGLILKIVAAHERLRKAAWCKPKILLGFGTELFGIYSIKRAQWITVPWLYEKLERTDWKQDMCLLIEVIHLVAVSNKAIESAEKSQVLKLWQGYVVWWKLRMTSAISPHFQITCGHSVSDWKSSSFSIWAEKRRKRTVWRNAKDVWKHFHIWRFLS